MTTQYHTGVNFSDADLWELYRNRVPQHEQPADDDGFSNRLRARLIEHYVYLTKRVVGKMKKSMPAHVEAEDLESFAKIGLIQAVTRYDNTIGVPFEAFATQRMRSCIMDAIREADWAPRSLRKKQREIRQAEEAFIKEADREPSHEELAERLEVSVEDLVKTRHQTAISAHTYIEASPEAQNKPASLDPEEDELVSLMKTTVSKCLRELPVRQAAILALHYYDEKKLAEISQLLKISEVKIGTLHAEAVLYVWESLQSALKSDD